MELGLSLGDSSIPLGFFTKGPQSNTSGAGNNGVGLCMALGINSHGGPDHEREKATLIGTKIAGVGEDSLEGSTNRSLRGGDRRVSLHPPLQLDLLPFSPVPRNPQGLSENGSSEAGSSGQQMGLSAARALDVYRLPPPSTAVEEEETEDGVAGTSSPNSVASSFRMDFCIYGGAGGNVGGGNKRDTAEAAGAGAGADGDRAASSNEDENGLARKKLRLSKEQSAYLEESFKEHNTLNPKQKLALAKQLNLRPRQVEVWFQNRRARTKLKQTEVDCEYLKRCCETLTEENRRLHKELQELRALKSTNSNPFYMQLPATTLTMCPSCERVATTNPTAASPTGTDKAVVNTGNTNPFPISRPMLFPFSRSPPQPGQSSAASSWDI